MYIQRKFTQDGIPVENQIKWKTVDAVIKNADGSTHFEMKNIEVPEQWSQDAINILAQKYFRKAGVPKKAIPVTDEIGIPRWLARSEPSPNAVHGPDGSETSAKQAFHRIAGAWTYHGWKEGMFATSESDAHAFYDEIYYILAMQMAAPNSPQWFNTGLHWAYGIEGPAQGQWAIDHNTGEVFETKNAYERCQPHACFIQTVEDDLVNPGGIMDLWQREVRLFKQGSGTGSNFSKIRGKNEKLSGGGVSSGLMTFLKIGDTAAGAVSSGGVTRRAAKMIVVDADHPEIEDYIGWKVQEENKAAAMYVGSVVLNELKKRGGKFGNKLIDGVVPQPILDRILNDFEIPIYPATYEGEAINTVSGQNANNSVSIIDAFLQKVDENSMWQTIARTNGEEWKRIPATSLWEQICRSAWASGDPGLQFKTTINKWHTCKVDGEIEACNPCSEYQFLCDTACNLASLNLCAFEYGKGNFNIDAFIHVCRLFTMALEISVYMASFPSREIAVNSEAYRTLGLGYANLGALLMRWGLPYDSDEGRELAAGLTALQHGTAYWTSSLMADELGAFSAFERNSESMLEVVRMHCTEIEMFHTYDSTLPNNIYAGIVGVWENLIKAKHFRNAQVTTQAPTGTISFVMDCDTTGVEPDFALVKYKSLAGGGMMKIVNQSIPTALKNLNYSMDEITAILEYVKEKETIEGAPGLQFQHLPIFDCANRVKNGTRFIRPLAHVLMMEGIQKFTSGAISKTCNLPYNATVADIDFIYREAHRRGIKAIAVYRDGSKLTQPYAATTRAEDQPNLEAEVIPLTKLNGSSELHANVATTALSRHEREPLPMRRKGYRQKFQVDGQSIYMSTGEYDDGRFGELFVSLSREGSTVRSIMECFGKAISIGIQYGVPLEEYVEAFIFTHFEPAGIIQGGPDNRIKFCSSIVDLIFRELGVTYLKRNDLANIPLLDEETEASPSKIDSIIERAIRNFADLSPAEQDRVLDAQQRQEVRTGMMLARIEEANIPIQPRNDLLTCRNCGQPTVVRTGSCVSCRTCGDNSGCG